MTSIYLRPEFWQDAAERAVRAFATSSLMLLTTNVAGILDVDVKAWLSGAALAVVISVLTSLLGARVGDDSAGFVSK